MRMYQSEPPPNPSDGATDEVAAVQIAITYDLYGHLFPGTRDRAGQQLQAYIDAETSGTA